MKRLLCLLLGHRWPDLSGVGLGRGVVHFRACGRCGRAELLKR